jgi:NTP pyrophosphatase (non-canonical NTP hydrolase)
MENPNELMEITIKYIHFDSLNKNVLRLGNEVRELTEQLAKAKRDLEALREAGDEVWYCYRHREPLAEAMQEWAEARDGNYK